MPSLSKKSSAVSEATKNNSDETTISNILIKLWETLQNRNEQSFCDLLKNVNQDQNQASEKSSFLVSFTSQLSVIDIPVIFNDTGVAGTSVNLSLSPFNHKPTLLQYA